MHYAFGRFPIPKEGKVPRKLVDTIGKNRIKRALESGLTVAEAAKALGCTTTGLRGALHNHMGAWYADFRIAKKRRNASARVGRSKRKRRALELIETLREDPRRWDALRASQRELAVAYGYAPPPEYGSTGA